ncbi:MBL fold metallo-hydrolase [Solimicrobium silvestre]|uniref:Metallo-beta-lactamase superfamily n=1 Tax=Solimicrobium silvestre TaxID=2099400 RepID=A0A2S9H2U1_9BURK|nr:MBL fold metallo-hydrolase [Solimicrobium silvestre]PRC94288.1 Metallo-beta-lactamase superfamily [Solimicrobium silvestre]
MKTATPHFFTLSRPIRPTWCRTMLALVMLALFTTLSCQAQDVIPLLLTTKFSPGASDCDHNPPPPLEIRQFDATTYVLRESLCVTDEAPFMYLIIGSTRALLIDTGDVADPKKMPLAQTVLRLLPAKAGLTLPLLVAHSHRHSDHREGDVQFRGLPNVEVIGHDIDSVKTYFGFVDWPNGEAHIDLGGRIVDVIPTPGHNETHVAFYDRTTALVFSGDFLMPGRLLINDKQADLASARRMAAFASQHLVSYVLGGHVEINDAGETFSWGATMHANEHVLPLTKKDLMALPEAVEHFNHFYTHYGSFIMQDQLFVPPFLTLAAPDSLVLLGSTH